MPSVGVVVFALGESQQVDRCVESLAWADAVQVCELGDGSTRPSFERDTTDWVLYLWGEERVDAELSAAVREAVKSEAAPSATQYRVRVRSRFLESWLEASCWGPVPSARLVRRGQDEPLCGWAPDSFHARDVPVLPGWISDYSLEELSRGVDQLNALSGIWARSVADVPHGPLELIHLPFRVLSRLLLRNKLCMRGLAGAGFSTIASYSCLATLMKAWEMRFASNGSPPRAPS